MFGIMPLTPAYARDYASKKEVLEAWENGKDFQTTSGRYCSQRDFPDGEEITIRYRERRLVMSFKNKRSKS